ncbi:hypothetical protein OIV83_002259 [Microbotryomycetes sp. JL201]|nr:hypothetical protein OIV83_002259 [Microbotryomycetes sp. JL201]
MNTSTASLDGLLPLPPPDQSTSSTPWTADLAGDSRHDAPNEITLPSLAFQYDDVQPSLIDQDDGFVALDPALGSNTYESTGFLSPRQTHRAITAGMSNSTRTDAEKGDIPTHLNEPKQSGSGSLLRSPKIIVSQEAKAADLKASDKRRRKAEAQAAKLKSEKSAAPKKRGRPKGSKDKPRDPFDPNAKPRGRPPGGKNKPRDPDDPRPGPGRPSKYPPGMTEREKRKISKAARLARKAAALSAASAGSENSSPAPSAHRVTVEPARNADGDYITDDRMDHPGASLLDTEAYPPPPSLESGMLEFQRNLAAQQAEAVRAATAAANLEEDEDDEEDMHVANGHADGLTKSAGQFNDMDLVIDPAIRLQTATSNNDLGDIPTGFEPLKSIGPALEAETQQ